MSSVLSNTPLADLVFDKKGLWKVESNDSIEQVLQFLKEHQIQGAPVWDDQKSQYVGMIDTWDIMSSFAVGTYFSDNVNVEYPSKQLLNTDFFKEMTVAKLLSMNERTRVIHGFEPTDTLQSLLKPMGEMGVHRCLVSQRDDIDRHHCWKMISRTDLIKFIVKHEKDFGALLNTFVDELGLGFETSFQSAPSKVLTCKPTDVALSVYQKMYQPRMSAMAIVDNEGKLIGTFSASDLKGITVDKLHTLLLSVTDFLRAMNEGQYIPKPVTCHPKSYIKTVLEKAIAAKVHRVWVVNSSLQPVGVVSYSDIISALKDERIPPRK